MVSLACQSGTSSTSIHRTASTTIPQCFASPSRGSTACLQLLFSGCVWIAAINGAREAPDYFASQCYLAGRNFFAISAEITALERDSFTARACAATGAYNKVAMSLLQQEGVAQSEAERADLVVEAYEKCNGVPLCYLCV